jgi:hypothetical protein
MINLNAWHHALHQVTGGMALRWCRATKEDLTEWARELRAVAAAMESASTGGPSAAQAVADPVPDWIAQSMHDKAYTNP